MTSSLLKFCNLYSSLSMLKDTIQRHEHLIIIMQIPLCNAYMWKLLVCIYIYIYRHRTAGCKIVVYIHIVCCANTSYTVIRNLWVSLNLWHFTVIVISSNMSLPYWENDRTQISFLANIQFSSLVSQNKQKEFSFYHLWVPTSPRHITHKCVSHKMLIL